MALINKFTFNILYGDDLLKNKNLHIYDCFEVDDMIAPVISKLNKKGYYTLYCCSGHDDCDSTTYISFEPNAIPPVIPYGFCLEDNDYYNKFYPKMQQPINMTTIRKTYEKQDFLCYQNNDRLIDIVKTMIDLNKFADNLPSK